MLTRDNLPTLALKALHAFGEFKQLRRYTEECGEAGAAAMRFHDGRGTAEKFAEELIGHLVTAQQMETVVVNLIGCDAYNRIWGEQLAKLAKAIEEART